MFTIKNYMILMWTYWGPSW